MQIQDYDMIIKRLEGLVRRAETFNHSKEDVIMNIRFAVEGFRLAQSMQEEEMIKELMAA